MNVKDFYDLYCLLRPEKFDPNILPLAIAETFKNRGTSIPKSDQLFPRDFHSKEERVKQWTAFLKKSRLHDLDFEQVIRHIHEEMQPVIDTILKKN